jgi:8-oxo-dGTP pyrophosphatase MutT (NUDIX family)
MHQCQGHWQLVVPRHAGPSLETGLQRNRIRQHRSLIISSLADGTHVMIKPSFFFVPYSAFTAQHGELRTCYRLLPHLVSGPRCSTTAARSHHHSSTSARGVRCSTRYWNDQPLSMSSAKPKSKFEVRSYSTHKNPAAASPSASIILVSPTNEILLVHRVKTSSAFPSAHVFPGGNLDPQDGDVPTDPKDPARHKDSLAYRTGAIRELFEETGILLAKESSSATSLLSVSPEDRLAGRQAVHSGKVSFRDWLASQSKDAVLHTEGLIPFTHWVTPP